MRYLELLEMQKDIEDWKAEIIKLKDEKTDVVAKIRELIIETKKMRKDAPTDSIKECMISRQKAQEEILELLEGEE